MLQFGIKIDRKIMYMLCKKLVTLELLKTLVLQAELNKDGFKATYIPELANKVCWRSAPSVYAAARRPADQFRLDIAIDLVPMVVCNTQWKAKHPTYVTPIPGNKRLIGARRYGIHASST